MNLQQRAAKRRPNLAPGVASAAGETLACRLTNGQARFSRRRSVATLLIVAAVIVLPLLNGCSKPATNQGPAPSQTDQREVRSSADVVTIGGTGTAIRENSGDAMVMLIIQQGYHVNANPATYPYLIATEVIAGKIEGLEVGQPTYPPAKKQKFEFADEPLAVYEGQVEMKLPIKVASKGTRLLPLQVRVQACDHEKCFPPATLNTNVAVEVK